MCVHLPTYILIPIFCFHFQGFSTSIIGLYRTPGIPYHHTGTDHRRSGCGGIRYVSERF